MAKKNKLEMFVDDATRTKFLTPSPMPMGETIRWLVEEVEEGIGFVELPQEEAMQEASTGLMRINTPGFPPLDLDWELKPGRILLHVTGSPNVYPVLFKRGQRLEITKGVEKKLREEQEQFRWFANLFGDPWRALLH